MQEISSVFKFLENDKYSEIVNNCFKDKIKEFNYLFSSDLDENTVVETEINLNIQKVIYKDDFGYTYDLIKKIEHETLKILEKNIGFFNYILMIPIREMGNLSVLDWKFKIHPTIKEIKDMINVIKINEEKDILNRNLHNNNSSVKNERL